MTKIRAWYAGLPDPVKAACAMFAMAFLGIFVPALLGWLTDVQSWLADLGASAPTARPFPDPDILTKAAFAAASAAFLALINWAFREAQRHLDWLPGSGPHYEDADGAVEVRVSGGEHLTRGPFPESKPRAR